MGSDIYKIAGLPVSERGVRRGVEQGSGMERVGERRKMEGGREGAAADH